MNAEFTRKVLLRTVCEICLIKPCDAGRGKALITRRRNTSAFCEANKRRECGAAEVNSVAAVQCVGGIELALELR
jgi:hypothetical protein